MGTGRERSKLILKDIKNRQSEFESFVKRRDLNEIYTLYERARRLGDEKKHDEALENLRAILAQDPDHVAALRLSAETARDAESFEVSLDFWKKLAALDRKNIVYKWKICRCLTRIGIMANDEKILEAAIEAGHAALKIKKRDPDALASLAMSFHAAGRIEDALKYIRKAVQHKCDSLELYKRLEKKYSLDLRSK